jgi:hypothetical protein
MPEHHAMKRKSSRHRPAAFGIETKRLCRFCRRNCPFPGAGRFLLLDDELAHLVADGERFVAQFRLRAAPSDMPVTAATSKHASVSSGRGRFVAGTL